MDEFEGEKPPNLRDDGGALVAIVDGFSQAEDVAKSWGPSIKVIGIVPWTSEMLTSGKPCSELLSGSLAWPIFSSKLDQSISRALSLETEPDGKKTQQCSSGELMDVDKNSRILVAEDNIGIGIQFESPLTPFKSTRR